MTQFTTYSTQSPLAELAKKASVQKKRQRLLNSFEDFVKEFWHVVDPAKLKWSHFMSILCKECQNWVVNRDALKNLALAVPPGCAKSTIAGVMLPAWMWARDPSNSFLIGSAGQELTVRDNVKCRDLMRSEDYQDLFVQDKWEFKKDQDQKTRYQNTELGYRQGVGGKSGITGWRANDIIIDDPVDLNPRKPPRDQDYESAWEWIKYLRSTRVNDMNEARTLLIMQRSSDIDPVGRILEEEAEDWTFVFFDMEYDPDMPHRHPDDLRSEPGELLDPERMNSSTVAKLKRALGPDRYAAQCQQTPNPISGNIVSAEWIIEMVRDAMPELKDATYRVNSWDCAIKDGESSSWVVGGVWGIWHPHDLERRLWVLYDVFRQHVGYIETKEAIRNMLLRNPSTNVVLIEDKANGAPAIQELSKEIPFLHPYKPEGSKEQRLRSVSPIIYDGRLITPKDATWVNTYKAELSKFPRFGADDQVDMTTQTIIASLYQSKQWDRFGGKSTVVGGW